ncbi:hypothetical protein DV735_g5672, partial [Chaetothyriales sp. CBS 134920]
MAAKSLLRRSLLYAYDLEDSVTPGRKAEARALVRKALDQDKPANVKERAVRINSVGSGLALQDLQEVVKSANLTTILAPKVESASDLTFIKHATPGLLSGLIFAAEDFAHDLSITRTPSLKEFLFARSAIVTAARAHDLPSTIDLVATAYKSEADQERLVEECEDGHRMGFNGKQCIHPSQVATVNRIFSPSQAEVEWAVRTVIAQKKAEEQGRGAWSLDGKMIDKPVERKAEAIVGKARLSGFDVEGLLNQHKDQEPE